MVTFQQTQNYYQQYSKWHSFNYFLTNNSLNALKLIEINALADLLRYLKLLIYVSPNDGFFNRKRKI